MTSDDFYDPARNIAAAANRAHQAHAHLAAGDRLDALHQLEKAHYRLERAEAEIVADLLELGTSWTAIATALQMRPGEARRRFREAV